MLVQAPASQAVDLMQSVLDHVHVPWEAVRNGRAGRASKALATVSMSMLKVR